MERGIFYYEHGELTESKQNNNFMKQIFFLAVLFAGFNVSFGQALPDIFNQLQENVWYLPTPDGEAEIYMTSIGRGDTIVTLHGGPGNDFNYLVDGVKGNSGQNTFIFFDQRGSLLSPVNDSLISSLTINVLVEDLETIRKALGQDKMVLFGHSFGSLLAMFYYIKYPERVKGIILSATMPPFITEEKPFKEILGPIHQRIKELRNRPEVSIALENAGLLNDSLLTPKKQSDRFKITGNASFNMYNIADWKKFKGGGVYYNSEVDGAIGSSIPETYDITPSLEKFPVPITVIQGDRDYIDPSASHWNEIIIQYEFVKLFTIEYASHNIWLDDKKKFDLYLEEAIARLWE